MRKETFLEMLSDIDDDLIEEAEKIQKKKHKNIMKYLATAACICIVLGGSLIGSFVEYSEEKTAKTSPTNITKRIAEAEEENATYDDKCKTDETKNTGTQFNKSQGKENTEDKAQEEKKQSGWSKKAQDNNWYNGDGTGEFVFNKKLYYIVNNTEYLISNSLPVKIAASDVGSNLANNVYDTANNNIGNVYEYKNENNNDMDNEDRVSKEILIVQDMNGIYNFAVEK